jgi:hypothetical protein
LACRESDKLGTNIEQRNSLAKFWSLGGARALYTLNLNDTTLLHGTIDGDTLISKICAMSSAETCLF